MSKALVLCSEHGGLLFVLPWISRQETRVFFDTGIWRIGGYAWKGYPHIVDIFSHHITLGRTASFDVSSHPCGGNSHMRRRIFSLAMSSSGWAELRERLPAIKKEIYGETMKNIVICCDGTWNTPEEKDKGVPAPSNVARFRSAVSTVTKNGVAQHPYYHAGVGTDGGWINKTIGGGTGSGLNANIMSAYRELCDYYETGDQIFMVGFSRGAYTVRSLAGMVSRFGLLDPRELSSTEVWSRIDAIFQHGYRERVLKREDFAARNWAFLHGPQSKDIPIRFLGVWDTVGALGIPDDFALLNLLDSFQNYTFHDTGLSAMVESARHAVSLDERRASFRPTLWTSFESARQDVKECWFPGVHSDVGGGYREKGLADAALKWMMEEAQSCGLGLSADMVAQLQPNFRDVMHDSCEGIFSVLPTRPRSIPRVTQSTAIHESALNRYQNPPIDQSPYRHGRELSLPAEVDIFAAQQWNDTGIWMEEGKCYELRATGQWMDASIKSGPAGCDDGQFQLGELAQMFGSLLGKMETLYKSLTHNTQANFWMSKRQEAMPWFALVGEIANAVGLDDHGAWKENQTFLIGDGYTVTPQRSGYFYAYANDAWNFYGNNKGRVRLAVSLK
ncbi:DUF2235 domain-containing protein [Herbaspirillum huttiense]|uniref:DUF2235 domain-containing protein n=1 Tax=Herbaspirillum huttiense TaxID=863372 RepID=UPI0039AF1355